MTAGGAPDVLPAWNDGATKQAIVDFVRRVSTPGSDDFVSAEERVAVFDNDGTLWCERPAYIQLDFIVRRLAAMAEDDPSLRDRQPWQAARQNDLAWFGAAVAKHYQGDDTAVQEMMAGLVAAHAGITVEEFEQAANAFLRSERHPTLDRSYLDCGYAPMVELLRYLEANGFTCYIASGGGRDFMRPITEEMYGIPRERVIGSTIGLRYEDDDGGGNVVRQTELEVFDDGPEKPVRIWSRIGRRPILAAGNSNGDIPMLHFTRHGSRPSLQLLLLHDDADREFAYTTGAEHALAIAEQDGWIVVSIKNDWNRVFPPTAEPVQQRHSRV
jgi:phosphoserine phosphatase